MQYDYISNNDEYESLWLSLAHDVSESFRLTEQEYDRFVCSPTARLIGLLPQFAGTETPKRDGCSNLAVYLMSIRTTKAYYAHQPCDDRDVFARLHDIMNFNGGDRNILEKGMSLLALMMLNDYKRDQREDREASKYNPIDSGAWDYDTIRRSLLGKAGDDCGMGGEGIDEILTVSQTAVEMWE